MPNTLASFGEFTILGPVSEDGTLGPLYRARDERTGRTIALRFVRGEVVPPGWRREKLLAAAAAARKVSHPHVAALYEVGEIEGQLFLAHEFVPGEPLAALLDGRALDQQKVIDLGIHVAEALAEAERCGIVHRDIQPAAVIVTPRDQAKLIDLGFASWTSGGIARRKVSAELSVGQEWWEDGFPGSQNRPPSYMSPEEALGQPLDRRSDLFSLGILLYQMATGQMPFGGATDAGTALKIVQATPVPPSRVNPSIAPQLDGVISRLLVKDLEGRYQQASGVAAHLRQLSAELQEQELRAPAGRNRVDGVQEPAPPKPAIASVEASAPVTPRPGGGLQASRRQPRTPGLAVAAVVFLLAALAWWVFR